MGRGATKAAGNVWYEARMDAAKWNDKLSSRAGAAEALNMSEDAVKDAELGLSKCMPVDKAVLMADLYNAPQLKCYYCNHECPIGRTMPISAESLDIDRVTVKLLKNLRVSDLEEVKDKLIDIADDGKITDDEKPELKNILSYLDICADPEDSDRANKAVAMHYVLQDAVDRLSDELNKLEGDCRVVDAIYAANDVRRQTAP